MLRRAIRERKEFIQTLENERKWQEKYSEKQVLKRAALEGHRVPTELFKKSESLKKELATEDVNTEIPRNHLDDEYATSSYQDPLLLITTSRSPSSRLTQFAKQLGIVLPNAIRIRRGGYQINDLANICRSKAVSDLVVLHEHRGVPDGLVVSHFPLGPTVYFSLSNVVLRHDIKDKVDKLPQEFPHLIFDGFSTKLGERVTTILKHLFPVPKADSKRVITFSAEHDQITFRHHSYRKEDHKTLDLNELGPRFELRPFQVVLGTIEQGEATKQWVLRPFINTAAKNAIL